MSADPIQVRVEDFESAAADIEVLCVRHWEEIAQNKDKIKLAPAMANYQALHAAKRVHITTARSGGELVGYLVYIVGPHLHYADSLTAFADVLYLAPEWRKASTAGLRLLKVSEASLRGMGVQRILQNVKKLNDWSPILKRSGYAEFETLYQKVLV